MIKIATAILHLEPSRILADHVFDDAALLPDASDLLAKESFLRRTAYQNTSIKTGAGFYDDSDMVSDYNLLIVYDKISGTPLLSCRYYADASVISACLQGDDGKGSEIVFRGETFDPHCFQYGRVVLADRLSGYTSSSLYRRYRSQIFACYYSEMKMQTKDSALILMVRKEGQVKQIARYLEMGFELLGVTMHKGKEHSIIIYVQNV